ncbi:biotin carboxylase N-terminal domain-containing protein [Humidisolicoccus flavus]
MFQTVLIANRGEIACRVIATLHKLGIRAVAIFSEADSEAKHVQLADAAVCVGPASASESYLNIANIIAAAKQTGAEAVHPGYGFLAESAAFAQACEDAGIVFLGPSSTAIDVMGDKIRAKRQVESRQVPTVPGAAETDRTAEEFVEDALAVGFPLLIKPSAGGGGKACTSSARGRNCSRRFRRRSEKRSPRSATTSCSWNATSRTRGTSRCR